MKINISTHEVHPITFKLFQKGHPWITKDECSKKFDHRAPLINAHFKNQNMGLFLHDPDHPTVVARYWGPHQKERPSDFFPEELRQRLTRAISKREVSDRDNYYLVFSEVDELPGLMILKLKDQILIQLYTDFWRNWIDLIKEVLITDLNPHDIWIQQRTTNAKDQKVAHSLLLNKENTDFVLNEFGVNYRIKIGEYYDHGIYTDMASIRKSLKGHLSGKSVLNLFCYTGCYSLYALHHGANKVTSVDLSKNYISWLEENLSLNPLIDADKHQVMVKPAVKALKRLKENEVRFNFIICDPPSSYSNGKKKTKAIHAYDELLPLIDSVLESSGEVICFLNTHNISMKKFEERINKIIEKNKLKLKVQKKYFLGDDCPRMKGFPEGDYLKGLLLKRV
jgi:23S rRNA (cytosine1962-C5)-methyltransferase